MVDKMTDKKGYERSAHLYDLFDDKDNIDFFKSYAKDVDRVLDVGAGTGRIAIPIAEEGQEVYCVEPSPSMKGEIDKKRDEKLYSKIKVINKTAKDFDLDEDFNLVIMSGVFDHLIKDEDRICTLLNINKHMVKDGKLVFDVGLGFMDESKTFDLVDTVIEEGKEYKRFIKREKIGDAKLLVTLRYEIYEDGELIETVEEGSEVGIINRDKIRRLLDETGFEIKHEFGDYSYKPYEEGDKFCMIEAIKKE